MRRWLIGLVMSCSMVLLAISIYFLTGIFVQEQKDNAVREQVKAIYQREPDGDKKKPAENWEDSSEPDGGATHTGLLALQEENPDCIGWLTIPGTMIDYPVMYRPGEENYYLKRDFYGNYSASGCLFLSELCKPEESDNLIIYGHHMNSGKMFAALDGYKRRAFYEEHPLIFFTSLQGEETYQVIAAFCTPVYTGTDFTYYTFTKAEDKAAYDAYIEAVKKRSVYDTGNTAVYGDKLLTLSTCEYSQENGRMVVVAKKINQQDGMEGRTD
ncbi:class B sortase [Lacrimispora xylanisolvens]|uniref:class B sortase n=1 Tax=Lacrimispora xylanisolvens TaxID=384636 RepID=UPI002402B276